MLAHLWGLRHLLGASGKDYMNVIAGILSLEGECEVGVWGDDSNLPEVLDDL